jgi:hypothetical protein
MNTGLWLKLWEGTQDTNRTDWRNSKTADLYAGRARFESSLELRLYLRRLFVVFSLSLQANIEAVPRSDYHSFLPHCPPSSVILPSDAVKPSYSLTSRSCALLEEPPVVQSLKNSPKFYGTWKFITVFTRALHWSLSWARSIQSIPSHPIYLKTILTLSTHLRLRLPSGLFPSGFPTNILHTFLFSPFVLHALISYWQSRKIIKGE